jgi:hypothetical protein
MTTGADCAGPIGDFHLVVDKGAPDSLAFAATASGRSVQRHSNGAIPISRRRAN